MFMRVIAALVAGLLSISCTANEADQPTPATPGNKVRVLPTNPIEEIAINEQWCDETTRCIPDWGELEEDRPKAKALVAELREDSPSWLRYVLAVDLRVFPPIGMRIEGYGAPPPASVVEIRTGIARNKPGIEVARTICQSVLDRGIDSVIVWGRLGKYLPLSSFNRTMLAKCRS
jgi:hypothetical protein